MINQGMNGETLGRLLVAAATLAFGSIAIQGKLAYAAGANELTTLAFRFAIGTAALWGLLRFEGRPAALPFRDTALLAILGSLGMGGVTGMFFAGLKHIPASLAIMVMYTYPIFLALLTTLIGRENFRPRQGLALAFALSGVGLTLAPAWGHVRPAGVLWVLGAAILHSLYIFVSGRVVRRIDPPVMTAYLTAAAALGYMVLALATGRLQTGLGWQAWLPILGLGLVSTTVGLRLLWAGIRLVGVNQAALITTMEPLVTTILAVLVLGESWGIRQTMGAAMLLAGVWWIPQHGAGVPAKEREH